jgi:16S rRNA (cytosine967-C5)-methyltransferase
MNSRQFVLKIMTGFDKRPGNLDRLIEQTLDDTYIDHRDRRLIFEIVYGIVRHMATLDYMIDRYVTDEKYRADRLLRRILRIGFYQLLYLDRVPDHASVNETVNLAKSVDKNKQFAGTVNAIMRALINHKKQIVYPDPKTDMSQRLAIEYSHPKWMIERWLKNYGLGKTKELLNFNNEKPAIYLRRSLRAMSRQQFEGDVRLMCDVATGYRDLYYRLKKSLLPESIEVLRQGFCNIQAPSSGWIVALLDVQRGDHILDLCAAPGGKTVLMAEIAGESGTVCACEVQYKRLEKVVETAERMKLHTIYPLASDGKYPPFNGVFDKIMLDAPCTASGVLHRHPEARWIRTLKDIERLTKVQGDLLDSAAQLVEADGVIVYATCSLEPEENEAQINNFLEKHSEFILESSPDSIPSRYIDSDGYLRITPFEHHMDGMFGARLRRIR